MPIATGVGGLAPRSEIHVAIRSDRMRIGRVAHRLRAVGAPGDGIGVEATLVSRVAAIEYQGSSIKLRLEADGIDELIVTLPDGVFFADPVSVGDSLAVGWSDADAHVVR